MTAVTIEFERPLEAINAVAIEAQVATETVKQFNPIPHTLMYMGIVAASVLSLTPNTFVHTGLEQGHHVEISRPNTTSVSISFVKSPNVYSESAVLSDVLPGYTGDEGSADAEMNETEFTRIQKMIDASAATLQAEVKRLDERISALDRHMSERITAVEKALDQQTIRLEQAIKELSAEIKESQKSRSNRLFTWTQTLVVGISVAVVTFLLNYLLKWLPQPPSH